VTYTWVVGGLHGTQHICSICFFFSSGCTIPRDQHVSRPCALPHAHSRDDAVDQFYPRQPDRTRVRRLRQQTSNRSPSFRAQIYRAVYGAVTMNANAWTFSSPRCATGNLTTAHIAFMQPCYPQRTAMTRSRNNERPCSSTATRQYRWTRTHSDTPYHTGYSTRLNSLRAPLFITASVTGVVPGVGRLGGSGHCERSIDDCG